MARGWESKSVEARREDRDAVRSRAPAPAGRVDGLRLSRTRVLHDLESARHPRYRAQLEAALVFLDGEIAKLL